MYLGERDYWGRGVGQWATAEIVAEAARRDLRWVYGRIGKHNDRSLAVHQRLGFRILRDDGDTYWLGLPAQDSATS